MQAWKKMCVLVLGVKKVVHSLNLSKLEPKLSLFQSSMSTAGMKIHPGQYQRGSNDTQLCQLICCLGTLIKTLVSQLEQLEASFTAATISICSRNIKSTHLIVYDSLWTLLCTSCNIFGRMPKEWPVRDLAEYQSIQEASHSLMSFLLRIIRVRSPVWLDLWERIYPEYRKNTAVAMLHVPITYINSLARWPAHRMLQELASIPSHFVTLLSCLTLEFVEVLAPDAAAAAAAAKRQAGAKQIIPFDTEGIHYIVLLLSLGLGTLLNKLIAADKLLGSCKEKGFYAVLINPAVFQLFKRNLLIRHDYRTSSIMNIAKEYSSLESLKFMLDESGSSNNSASACIQETIMQATDGRGMNLISFHTPPVTVSDIQLLHILFAHLPAKAEDVDNRYGLVGALFRSWRGGRVVYVPIPASSLHDQVRCVYLTAHHCCVRTLVWMRQQLRYKQKLAEHECVHGASGVQDYKQVTSTCLQEMILHVCVRPRMHLWESQPGMSDTEVQPTPTCTQDVMLVNLLRFHRMPGSVVMLESSLRHMGRLMQAGRVGGSADVLEGITSSLPVFRQFNSQNHACMMPACINMAASVLKLVATVLLPCAGMMPENQQIERPDGILLAGLHLISRSFLQAVIKQEDNRLVSESSMQASLDVTGTQQLITAATCTSHLQSILLAVWVLICQSELQSSPMLDPSFSENITLQWLFETVSGFQKLRQDWAVLAQSLLVDPSPVLVGKCAKYGLATAQHAAYCFHGRLKPGCCNLNCTNLEGFSEAALRTQLCSGCRRARYCSVQCQRSAWLKGGHSKVCRL